MQPEKIADAGNTLVPAVLALRQRGFCVSCDENGDIWRAESEALLLVADDPLQLLGLMAMRDLRGAKWKASDVEIERTIREFGLA